MRIESGAIDEAKLLGRVPLNRWIDPGGDRCGDRQPHRRRLLRPARSEHRHRRRLRRLGRSLLMTRRDVPRARRPGRRGHRSRPRHRAGGRHRVRRPGLRRRRQRPVGRGHGRRPSTPAPTPGAAKSLALGRRRRRRRWRAGHDRRCRRTFRSPRRPRLERRHQPGRRLCSTSTTTPGRMCSTSTCGGCSTAASPPPRRWRDKAAGSIVVIGSPAAREAYAGQVHYSAAKAGSADARPRHGLGARRIGRQDERRPPGMDRDRAEPLVPVGQPVGAADGSSSRSRSGAPGCRPTSPRSPCGCAPTRPSYVNGAVDHRRRRARRRPAQDLTHRHSPTRGTAHATATRHGARGTAPVAAASLLLSVFGGDRDAVATGTAAATSEPPPRRIRRPSGLEIVWVEQGAGNPYWDAQHAAAEEAAHRLGFDFRVVSGDLDPAVQASVVQQTVDQGPDAIMVNAIDPSAIAEAYEYAADHDVPIVNLYGLDPNATASITFDEVHTGRDDGRAHARPARGALRRADRAGHRAHRHPGPAGERPARPGFHRLHGCPRHRGRRRAADQLAGRRGVGDDGELADALSRAVDGLRAQRHAHGAGDEHRRAPGPPLPQRRRRRPNSATA